MSVSHTLRNRDRIKISSSPSRTPTLKDVWQPVLRSPTVLTTSETGLLSHYRRMLERANVAAAQREALLSVSDNRTIGGHCSVLDKSVGTTPVCNKYLLVIVHRTKVSSRIILKFNLMLGIKTNITILYHTQRNRKTEKFNPESFPKSGNSAQTTIEPCGSCAFRTNSFATTIATRNRR